MNAKASNSSIAEKIAIASIDFASRFAATFSACLIAGAILLVGARMYVGWEANRFADKVANWQAEDEELQRKEAAKKKK